jgi:PAS domain S-box-containing protein
MEDKARLNPEINLSLHEGDYSKKSENYPLDAEEKAGPDTQALVHELQVHQIELETQNEELKRTRLAAEVALAKYSDRYDFAPIGLFTLGVLGQIIEVNIEGAALLGMERCSLVNKNFRQFVESSDRKTFDDFCKSAFETYAKQTCELALLKYKRPSVYARIEGTAIEDRMLKGKQCRIAVIDITERRRAEDALRLNDERARLAFENAGLGIARVDADGRIAQINAEFCRMLGYTKAELIGRCIFDLVHPDDQDTSIARSEPIKEGMTQQFSIQKRYTRKDGVPIWADVTISVISEGKGKSQFILVIARDISHQKMAKEALQESERRFRDAIDNFPNVFVIYDADRRIQHVNSKGLEIMGLSEERVIGRMDEEIFPPEMINSYLPTLMRALRTKRPQTLERTRPRAMGGQTIIVNIIPLLGEHGEVRRILSISHDITKRKQAEEALKKARDELEIRVAERTSELVEINEDLRRAKEAAEAADIAKSQFLATMSHELRTPLNAVIGMTSLLLDDNPMPEQRESIEIIKTSGEALLSLINEILDFSKMGKGKIDLERHPLKLRRCVEESIDLLVGEALGKSLNLSYLIDEDVPDTIMGDQTRLRQILGNLLSNAVKFTDAGEVIVSVSCQQKMWDLYEFHFCVRDTGIGIPQDQMSKLFKPFSQVDASNTRRYGGSGLGLAICKNLVEMMRGRIWAESEPGKGSIFHFTIPAEVQSDEASDSKKPAIREENLSPDLDRDLHVLLAEDDLLNQKVTIAMLKKLGCFVDAVANGKEAISTLERRHYDIVLMDMQMPEMDGLEATRIIRQRWKTAEQPMIIALTAHALEGDQERCIKTGMDSYIAKPIKIKDLKLALQHCSQLASNENKGIKGS